MRRLFDLHLGIAVFLASFAVQRLAAESAGCDVPRGPWLRFEGRTVALDANERQVYASVIPLTEDTSRGYRVKLESEAMAEVFDVDVARDEIRAFGLAFRPTRDLSGLPFGLTISGNGEEVTLSFNQDLNSLQGEQRSAAARLNKFFVASHGQERARQSADILRAIRASRTLASDTVHLDVFDCTMDVIGLLMDWAAVVGACGAPVVNLFSCGFAIAWATADTIRTAQAIAVDCAPNR